MSGRVATAIGGVGALLTWFAAQGILGAQAARTLWPEWFALTVGAGLIWALWGPQTTRTQRAIEAGIAVVIGLGFPQLVVAFDGDATHRTRFWVWMPWVSWGGVLLWVGAAWADRTRAAWARPLTAALVGVAVAASCLGPARYVDEVWHGERVRAWNIFHYHLGTQYFPELGYSELYNAVLAADDAHRRQTAAPATDANDPADFGFITRTRDMHSYAIIPRSRAVSQLDAELSPAQLEALGRDSRALLPWLRASTWRSVLIDLGYNPAPPWTLLRPLTQWISVEGPGIWWIANSDLPLWIAMLLALAWGFGPRVASAAVIFLVAIPFNEARWTGGMLQYDWLASAVIGMALWRRGWRVAAGIVLSWGAMTRGFPGLLMLPALGQAAWWALRRLLSKTELSTPTPTPLLRGCAAFVIACSVLFALGHTTGQGATAWVQWTTKISQHAQTHPITSHERLGIKRLALHAPSESEPWGEVSGTPEAKLARIAHRGRPLQLIALALFLPALLRRRGIDAMILMLYVAFVFSVTSRYYGSTWLLLAALALPPPGTDRPQGWAGVWSGAALLAMPGAMAATLPDETASYFVVNYLAWAMFVGAAIVFFVTDLRTPPAVHGPLAQGPTHAPSAAEP